MERKARLLGLDMPAKVAVTDPEGKGIPLETIRRVMERVDRVRWFWDKKYLPKVGFWDTLLLLLGQKSLRQLPNVSSEFDVTDLDEANTMHFSKSNWDDNPIAGSAESLIRPRAMALADAFRPRNSGNHRAK